MHGIESASGTDILHQLLNDAAAWRRKPEGSRLEDDAQGDQPVKGALARSRKFLEVALHETGFVDINSSVATSIKTLLERTPPDPEGTEVDVDSRTAAELAAYMGAEMSGDVNLVLRILSRIDPERVALLLK